MVQKIRIGEETKAIGSTNSKQHQSLNTLNKSLRQELVTVVCPNCGTLQQKMGSWLISIPAFLCPGCNQRVTMSYDQKLKIFERHLKSKAAKEETP